MSITKFAEELKPFGEAIKVFGNQVAGIDAATVEGAASAAKIMAEMAKTLPAQGGYIKKVFGEKSIADFAKQLLLFGPSIKQFSIIVKDIDPASVQGAADSAKIMAEVAKIYRLKEVLQKRYLALIALPSLVLNCKNSAQVSLNLQTR